MILSAAAARAQQPRRATVALSPGAAAETPDKLLLKDYHPRSTYRIPRTDVPKAKYPVIDVHNHGMRPAEQVDEMVKTMDLVGVEKVCILSGSGTPERFAQVRQLYSKYCGRFEFWCGFDLTGVNEPGFGPNAVKALEESHRMGAVGVGELSDKGRSLGGNWGAATTDNAAPGSGNRHAFAEPLSGRSPAQNGGPPMKTSRRSILGFSGGAALFASGCAGSDRAAASPQNPAPKLALEDFQPKSMLVAAGHPVARARFPVIDFHAHISGIFEKRPGYAFQHLDQILSWMEALNIQVIDNVTGGYGDQLKRNVRDLEQRYKGRFINCVTPGYDRLHDPGFSQWQADELKRAKEAGAHGLKVLKFLGLGLRENGKEGPLVKIDDPRFDPMWEAAGGLNLPALIHTSDPDAFFLPIDRNNERWEELGHHPEWLFYGKDYPSKPALLAARNRIIGRHPKTTFVGLHVANHPENLDEVSDWLRQYPNLHVDIAARLGELGRQPRRARQFFENFQDRILFGTDATPDGAAYPQQDLNPAMYQAYFRFLETLDEYFDYAPSPTPPQGRWRIYGIGLPPAILKKVYHNNAARLFGMEQV